MSNADETQERRRVIGSRSSNLAAAALETEGNFILHFQPFLDVVSTVKNRFLRTPKLLYVTFLQLTRSRISYRFAYATTIRQSTNLKKHVNERKTYTSRNIWQRQCDRDETPKITEVLHLGYITTLYLKCELSSSALPTNFSWMISFRCKGTATVA